MALPSNGPLSISQIQAEFGGPIPAVLSNYYRKTIQTAVNEYVFTNTQNVDALVASENGVYPSTFEDGYKYFTSDYGPIFPRDPLAYVSGLGQAQIVQVDGQNVSQTQGTLWGQNAIVRSWGCATYFKIRAGETYRFRCRMRALNNPTNTEGNPASHIMGLYLLGASGYGVAGHSLASYPIDANLGWVTREVTMSATQIWNLYPNAVWGRLYHHENYCDYTDVVGNYRQVPADCVVQTSMLEMSVASGQPLNGESGVITAYDLVPGRDRVLVKTGSTMAVAAGRTSAELGGPRQNTNPFTREIQRLGNFTVVDTPSTASIPTSGPIKFSDFLGTSQDAAPQWTTPEFLGEIYPGVPFSFQFNATSNSPINYSMISILPGWCSWNASTHTVTGTWPAPLNAPSQEADFIVGASNDYLTTSRQFIYRVVNREAVWSTPSGTIGNPAINQSFTYQLQASDPEGSNVSYIVHSGTLPPGISVSATGLVSGTPTTLGTYVFEIRLEDNVPRTSATARQFNIVVEEAAMLPPIEAYIVNTLAEYQAATAVGNAPPSQEDVFNSWARFDGADYYPSGTTPGGQAGSWVYSNGQVVSTVNSSRLIGFVSPENLEYYTHAVTVSSTASDNDLIGVIVAQYVDGDNMPHSIVAQRTGGSGAVGGPAWGLSRFDGTVQTQLVDMGASAPTDAGWATIGDTRIEVVRAGSTVTLRCSQAGSATLSNTTQFTYDLPVEFQGPRPYGYCALSQEASTFKNIALTGGLDVNTIYDARNPTAPATMAYENGAWVSKPARSIYTELGYPREVYNPDTGKTFLITGPPNASVTQIN